jgi:hypothetical protein
MERHLTKDPSEHLDGIVVTSAKQHGRAATLGLIADNNARVAKIWYIRIVRYLLQNPKTTNWR